MEAADGKQVPDACGSASRDTHSWQLSTHSGHSPLSVCFRPVPDVPRRHDLVSFTNLCYFPQMDRSPPSDVEEMSEKHAESERKTDEILAESRRKLSDSHKLLRDTAPKV
jgi:hypothetical protein